MPDLRRGVTVPKLKWILWQSIPGAGVQQHIQHTLRVYISVHVTFDDS